MDLHPLGILDLAAGIGQLGEATLNGLAAVGLHGRVLAHVERDSAAAAALRLRMEAAELDHAPIHDDLAGFDCGRFRGRLAGVCAGLPCPAFSSAGKRVGNFDPRAWGEGFDPDDVATWGPIPHAIRIVAECGAGFVFFENVPGWLRSGAFEPVGRELHGLGLTRQSAIFVAAEDVGANHGRERGFVLAVSEQWWRWGVQQIGRTDRRAAPRRASPPMADGDRDHEQRPDRCNGAGGNHGRNDLGRSGEVLADGECQRRSQHVGRPRPGDESHTPHSSDDLLAAGVGQADASSEGREGSERSGSFRDTTAAASGSPTELGTDVGNAEHQSSGCGESIASAHAAGREGGRPGVGAGGLGVGDAECNRSTAGHDDARVGKGQTSGRASRAQLRHRELPLYPPPRGTDLAAVAEAIGKAATRATRRDVTAAACGVARGIWRDWATVAAVDPTQMPAIESEIPMVVDGYPYAAADLLRIGGNCVVADAATLAFISLWNELAGSSLT